MAGGGVRVGLFEKVTASERPFPCRSPVGVVVAVRCGCFVDVSVEISVFVFVFVYYLILRVLWKGSVLLEERE